MKNTTNSISKKINTFLAIFLMISLYASAQNMPEVTVNGKSAGSWFSQNWLWITVFVVVLLLVLLLMGGSSRRKRTTTVVTDRNGHVQRSSTIDTETIE